MKVTSESEWQLLKSELVKDPDPRAEGLVDFITHWGEAADDWLAKTQAAAVLGEPLAIDALRATLAEAELKTQNYIPSTFVAHALLLLCHVWEPAAKDRDRFFDSLSPIERKLFVEIATMWQSERQRQAQEATQ
jgi:hypothetical protein